MRLPLGDPAVVSTAFPKAESEAIAGRDSDSPMAEAASKQAEVINANEMAAEVAMGTPWYHWRNLYGQSKGHCRPGLPSMIFHLPPCVRPCGERAVRHFVRLVCNGTRPVRPAWLHSERIHE